MARPVIAYADGADSARIGPDAVAALTGLTEPEVLLGWTPDERPWLASPGLRGRTMMAGYGLSGAVAAGRLRYLPVRLSAVPRLVEELRPEVAVVTGVRRGVSLAFSQTVGWGPAAVAAATSVVVEVDEDGDDLGGPEIEGNVVAVVPRPAAAAPRLAPRRPEPVDLAIGRNVASVLPDEPTLQLGPGGIAEAIVASLDRPVRIWSGLITDTMAELADRQLLVGTATAGYAWGGRSVARLAAGGRLSLRPIEATHDLTRVSALPRFVGCNTALQVGLDGSVNVERVAGRVVAGIGGHADYCAAAARSVGGVSIVALRSTTSRGRSTIVPQVDVVSTPRCDVELVVTEHGVADLRGVDDAERAERLVDVAAPEHRETLRRALAPK
ncbi:MAG TPA: acetyl-CoA hydrolase/transferase C-terminal domain-containing protein [Acidimicrobiales bacterium]|nr:acetyl-CoA hydrolase/transferase C-terminal domain-containing protein [Acidimicrobiales bacterium]